MAPPLLVNLDDLDLSRYHRDVAWIESINPHRGDMRQLDGIYHLSEDLERAVAGKQVREEEFWVPGHIPGRPMMPGVLMLEAAAQLACILNARQDEPNRFLGFTGIEGAKFRGQVVPGDELLILAQQRERRRRRFTCDTQGVVNGTLVFEARIQGMPM